MERTLTDFIRALRMAGAQVSSAEAIDAARTMTLIGFQDRQLMKDSLGLVLAKSEEEKEIHNRLFETFFSRRTEHLLTGGAGSTTQAEGSSGKDRKAPDSAMFAVQRGPGGGSGGDSEFLDLAMSNDPDRIAAAIERAGAAAGVDEIRFATQVAFYVRQILEQLGVEALEEQLRAKIFEEGRKAQAEARALAEARANLERHARAFVDQRFETFGRSATDNFMNDVVVNREIAQLRLGDMERMRVLVARMAKRLAVRHSRRRKVRNRGQLDMRRTMRANAGHDGVPFELVWRIKPKDKPKIVVICDVSGSVSRYARFLLLFLYSLKDEVTDLGAFAFSARLKDIGRELDSRSFESAMEWVVEQVGGGATDYGQALLDMKDHHWESIDRRTTLLVLGDGRSNHADPRLDIFQEAADRAKRVVWLCPEPQRRWGTGDSVLLQYKPFCTHLSHCATAADIERALDEVLMAYD